MSDHEPASARRDRERRSWIGPSLVRSAGYGFAAAALLQGALLAERLAGTAVPQDPAATAMAALAALEPAAGPEPGSPGQTGAGEPAADGRGCDPRLLRAIAERNRELDARASELADRARMLEVIEARAAEQVRALEAQRRALETAVAGLEEGAGSEIARLVKIYESMSPKEAARIFEAMPAAVAAGFIRRMSESKSAPVMGRLDPQHAYAIALAMANQPPSGDGP